MQKQKNIISFAVCSLFFALHPLSAQPVEPTIPTIREPMVSPVTARTDLAESRFRGKSQKGPAFPVRIALAGGSATNEGLLYPSGETITLTGLNGRKEIAITSVDRVIFRRWKGKNTASGGEWKFEPSEIEVYLKDGTRIFCISPIPELLQPIFQDRKKTTRIYSYFFDYYKAGSWAGSKKKAKDHPETNPANGCMRFIDFI